MIDLSMKSENHSSLCTHLFICTNRKENGESCAARGSLELRESLKKRIQKEVPHDPGTVRLNASGCLGKCSEGITAVLYPEGKWFTEITSEDQTALVEEVRQSYQRSQID